LQCGDAFSVGPFRIQLRQFPATSTAVTASPLGKLIDWMRQRPGNLYAIYDAARDGVVLDLLNAAKLKHLSLFDGDARDRMADAAPYLVEIPKDSLALELLVRASWGQGWASFLVSEAAFAEVRAQLRRSLIAQLPTGETAFFRFFDPAVLQAFLRGSNPKEWSEFAGPITEFIVEQREGPAIAVRLRVATATIETYRLEEIAVAVRHVADLAAQRRLTRELLADATFTVSNLGMHGIEDFDPLINPPQAAILGVGAAAGAADGRRLMRLTLGCDHRVLTGAEGAPFLVAVRDRLERDEDLFAQPAEREP